MTGEDIIKTLVDTVSKNGNFLLDIGPRNDGSIPDIMQTGLLDAGNWIHSHAESIFSTRYYQPTPGLDPFRYTTKLDAFYIHVLERQNGTSINIPDLIPYLPGDQVMVVGGSMNGIIIDANWEANKTITLNISEEIWDADKYIWTFKIKYNVTQ